MAQRTKGPAGIVKSLVEQIGELIRQPLSDESYEVPTAKAVRKSKRVAAGKKRRATAKKAKPAKKRATAKRKTKKR